MPQPETEALETSDAESRREAVWARHLERLSRLTRDHPLRYLFFGVTRRCNLRCAYCGSGYDRETRPAELDAAEWITVARQIASDFEPSRVMIAVTGGEPLLKPGIFEIFAALHYLGFNYGMVTNAFLVNERTAAQLVAARIGSISISMDAPGETNDLLRGAGASAKAEHAIRCLSQAGFDGKLEITSTITRPATTAPRYDASLPLGAAHRALAGGAGHAHRPRCGAPGSGSRPRGGAPAARIRTQSA